MVADLPSDKPVLNSTDVRNVPVLGSLLEEGVEFEEPAVVPEELSTVNGLDLSISGADPPVSLTNRLVSALARPSWIE